MNAPEPFDASRRAPVPRLGPLRHRTLIGSARRGGVVAWSEWFAYRDLFRFLIWREVKIRYAQSALGISWAIIQPLFAALIMMVVFGYIAGFPSAGNSKFLYYFAPLVPWTFFANALTDGTASLINNASMLGKVYFPRVVLPLAATLARLLDLAVAFVVLCLVMLWHGSGWTAELWLVPLLVGIALAAAAGCGLWLTALAIQYRDVKYAIVFVVQLLMYLSPVIYSASRIPTTITWGGLTLHPRWLYGLNPMAGVAEGFRAIVVPELPMPWDLIAMGACTSCILLLTGLLFFRRKERIFADVA